MAFTAADLAALDEAIATGALEVEYQDRKVRYRSLNDMLRTRAIMKQDIGGTPTTPSRRTFSFDKGV